MEALLPTEIIKAEALRLGFQPVEQRLPKLSVKRLLILSANGLQTVARGKWLICRIMRTSASTRGS